MNDDDQITSGDSFSDDPAHRCTNPDCDKPCDPADEYCSAACADHHLGPPDPSDRDLWNPP